MSPQELRLARESLNLTQTELATKIGVSLRTLQEWEKTKIPETKIAQVVKVLSESRMDDKLERLQKAVDALKYLGVFKTQQDAANQMLMSRPNFSAALNGSEKYFTENFLDRFLSVFGNTISSGWLLTGEGEMLIGDGSKMPLSPPPFSPLMLSGGDWMALLLMGGRLVSAKRLLVLLRMRRLQLELRDKVCRLYIRVAVCFSLSKTMVAG